MADDRILISVELDDGSVRQGFARIERTAETSGKTLGGLLSGPAVAGILAAGAALVGSFAFLKGAIAEAAAADQALNKLNTALRLAGTFTEDASQSFQKLASDIQDTTAFSDEQVLAVSSLARTYSRTNEAALELTKTSIDFASATGVDAESAVRQLAATLNGDLTRGLTRLAPELKALTREQLAAGGAIDILNAKLGGTAAQNVNTYEGRVIQLKNQFSDLLEVIGGTFTNSPAVLATITEISTAIRRFSAIVKSDLQGKDIFESVIINFSIVAQAGLESARQIGNGFELAYLRASQAWTAFKVLTTAGLSSAFNRQLQEVTQSITDLKESASQDSNITKFFDNLIMAVTSAKTSVKDGVSSIVDDTSTNLRALGGEIEYLSGPVSSLGQAMNNFEIGFRLAAQNIANDARKAFRDQGAESFKILVGGVTNGMAAIGKALVTGQNIFKAFAGAMLSAIGQALITEGGARILQGIARAFSSYGLDPTAQGLIATGSAMTVAGGAMQALGSGASGGSSVDTNIGGGGGGGGIGQPSFGDIDPALAVKDQQRLVVNIQGDVLDSRESGLRIVELINDAFDTQGAQVTARA